MPLIDKRIIRFIKKHHVLTLATAADNKPYCANCFYIYDEEKNLFIYTTSDDTEHGKQANKNPNVAASVVLETSTVGKIQGLQISGKMYRPENQLRKDCKKKYLKRFPYAAVMMPELWVLEPNFFKYTDNRLGFGKKLIWEKAN